LALINFPTTNKGLKNYILYARPQATKQEVIKACTAAHADEFIRNLPDGYHTIVGGVLIVSPGLQGRIFEIAEAYLSMRQHQTGDPDYTDAFLQMAYAIWDAFETFSLHFASLFSVS
jgi:hypothetical protein